MLFELAQTLERAPQRPFERDAHRLHAVALTVRLPTSLLDGLTLSGHSVRPSLRSAYGMKWLGFTA